MGNLSSTISSVLGSEDTDSGKSTQQGDVISGATIDLSGPPTQSAGPPNAKEIDWSLLLSLIKRKSYEEAANLMAIDPSLAKALQDESLGTSLVDRLSFVIQKKFFESVRDESHQQAARFAVLYAAIGCDIREALNFLNQHAKLYVRRKFDSAYPTLAARSNDSTSTTQIITPNDGITLVTALGKLYEAVAKVTAAHAYAEQIFDPRASLLLLRDLQPVVEELAPQYFALFIRRWNLQELVNEIRRNSLTIDPQELSDLLEEAVLVIQQTERYKIFMRKQYERGIFYLKHVGYTFFNTPGGADNEEEKLLNISNYIREPTVLYTQAQQLVDYYTMVEQYFLVSSITKAANTPIDIDLTTPVSPCVDYAFIAFQRVGERCLLLRQSSASTTILQAMRVIANEKLKKLMLTRLSRAPQLLPHAQAQEKGARSRMAWVSSLKSVVGGGSSTPPPPTNAGSSSPVLTREQRDITPATLAICVNDIITCSEYFVKLQKDLESKCKVIYKDEEESASILAAIKELGEQGAQTFKEASKEAADILLEPVWPSIRAAIRNFAQTPYEINQSTLKDYEINDPWVRGLISDFQDFFTGIKMCLLPAAIHEVVVSALTVIAAEVEQIALLKKFTHYGGLQLESDVRQLFTYFSSLTSKSVRDKFTRLREISSFLSIEKIADIVELWNESDDTFASADLTMFLSPEEVSKVQPPTKQSKWRISGAELKAFLKRRTDLNPAAVERLKL